MGTPLVQRLATSKTIIAPLLPLFLRLSSAVESESNRCIPSLSINKDMQNIYSSPLSIGKDRKNIYSLSLSIDKSTQHIYHLSLSIDKSTQNMYFSPFPMDGESVHCNFHALSTTDLAILSYH